MASGPVVTICPFFPFRGCGGALLPEVYFSCSTALVQLLYTVGDIWYCE